MNGQNPILVTGLPRAGTTLVCRLLGSLPDVIALDEPLDIHRVFAQRDADHICGEIVDFSTQSAAQAQTRGTAMSKQVDGRVVDNHADTIDPDTGLSSFSGALGEIRLENLTGAPVSVVLKHPFQFTACLDLLSPRFKIAAMIRNPLSVLASWNRVNFPIRKAQNPSAAVLAPDLANRLAAYPDMLDRQIQYLNWYFEQYLRHMPADLILRYEDMVAHGGATLQALIPAAKDLGEDLQSHNANAAYDPEIVAQLGARLLDLDLAFWQFYSRDSVAEIVQNF